MRKKIIIFLCVIICITAFGAVGVIYEEDFKNVGVSEKNILKAKDIIEVTEARQKLLLVEKKQLELEIEKYSLKDPEKNWSRISESFDKIGRVESEMKKNMYHSQIQIKKYITKEEYLKAKKLAIKRIQDSKEK